MQKVSAKRFGSGTKPRLKFMLLSLSLLTVHTTHTRHSHKPIDILITSDVNETSFQRDYPVQIFKHGQFQQEQGSRWFARRANKTHPFDKVSDNHASPAHPSVYLECRVQPKIREYQSRLPQLGTVRTVMRVLLLVATAASALLANVGFSNYVVLSLLLSPFFLFALRLFICVWTL